jgi:hypothetical protein
MRQPAHKEYYFGYVNLRVMSAATDASLLLGEEAYRDASRDRIKNRQSYRFPSTYGNARA